MAARNAASVLPEPVGARISALSPAWISGQVSSWARVGSLEGVGEPGLHRLVEAARTGCGLRAAPARAPGPVSPAAGSAHQRYRPAPTGCSCSRRYWRISAFSSRMRQM